MKEFPSPSPKRSCPPTAANFSPAPVTANDLSQTVAIVGAGHFVPEQIIANDAIENRLALEPGWIVRRTGFTHRRYCEPQQACSDLAVAAARIAIQRSGVLPESLAAVLLATSTPDHPLPGTAPRVAAELGISAPALDLMAACTGFLYGLTVGESLVRSLGRPVLLIAANVLSRRVDLADAQTVGLFGDGAGAVVLAPETWASADETNAAHPPSNGGTSDFVARIVNTDWASDGEHWQQLMIPSGGSRQALDHNGLEAGANFMKMESGRAVFKLAVQSMQNRCGNVLTQAHVPTPQIDWLIAHQASHRLVSELGKRLEIPAHRVAWWLGELGNSSAATLPIALSLGYENHRFGSQQHLLLAAAGAGMCSAAALLQIRS